MPMNIRDAVHFKTPSIVGFFNLSIMFFIYYNTGINIYKKQISMPSMPSNDNLRSCYHRYARQSHCFSYSSAPDEKSLR